MASAAKSALICMLLFAAAMAVHGNQHVSVKNETPLDVTVNGIDIAAGVTAVVNVTEELLGLVLSLVDSLGKEITASYTCPLGVTEVVLTKAVNGIEVTVGGVATAVTNLLGGLVNSLLGLVLGVLHCTV